ncbi:MAG: acyl carrier protein [Chloroflexi bacterium]|nr:acyl carrier protein [Chloroflexota bacterium]|tara:strand:+ start:618 stop:875 length:258 start_codon:yes stop_codon:yes gene_type:complete
MEKEQVRYEVYGILEEYLGVNKEKIKPENDIMEDLGADSLDSVEIIMAIEENFEIEIEDEIAEAMQSVEETVNSVYDKINNHKKK